MSGADEVVVVGDLVLDRDVHGRVERLCPDAPAPVVDVDQVLVGAGGAGLTALVCAAAGHRTTLVAPVADDDEGRLLRRVLAASGVRLVAGGHEGGTRVKTRLRSGSHSLLRIDHGGSGRPVGPFPEEVEAVVLEAATVVVSCYGAGTSGHPQLRDLLARRAPRAPVVWDPHPRGAEPVPGCALVTPNLGEARARLGADGQPGDVLAAGLVRHWSARAVAVTDGQRGAWLGTTAGEPVLVPAQPVDGDPCGAGDSFTAAAAVALAAGRTSSEAVGEAVRSAAAFVAAGGASAWRVPESAPEARRGSQPPRPTAPAAAASAVDDILAAVRRRGGTVVATGGCFDVLHAGHVATLEAARSLGDALVVLLNSDASVSRLKGPGRPVTPGTDRAKVLRGLRCVDAVVVFDEDVPDAALRRVRPDVWVKGGDYEGAELPEADLVRSWGGRTVLVPYLSGRSTSSILRSTTQAATR